MKILTLLFLCFLFFPFSNSGAEEFIVFSSDRTGKSNIYMIDSSGINLTQLTFGDNPKWSPRVLNKNEITFLEQRGDSFLRFKLNLKTKKITPLPQPIGCPLDDKNAIPSPNGKKLLYQCKNDVFISDPDGTNPQNLTQNSNARNFNPTWFPNGKKIAFTTNRDGNFEIYSMNLKGENLKNLTNHPSNDDYSNIAPDGKRILFTTNRDGKRNQEIYVLNLKNKDLENITNSPNWELIARWNSDGSQIFFGSNRDKNWEIYSYELATKTLKRFTRNKAFDGDPQFIFSK